MKATLLCSAIILFSLTQCCNYPDPEPEIDQCSTRATIKDLTGLDGCGFVFELEDGTLIQPIIYFYCGTGSFTDPGDSDPIFGYEFVDGKSVTIDYEIEEYQMNACMGATVARITCLTDVKLPTQD